ncbi:MAG: low specificity L-threonine aldolase [Ruminococcaceae bacterium]|nr:low specificity L-threonine aldolase [Oscillospiraceae bacterium]
MISFASDYIQGAHPKVLQRLIETNMEQLTGYGSDPYCNSAKEKIRKACNCPDADVYFMVGGTQTNMVVLDSILLPHEGVISPVTGHINGHESGAVESTGHKILQLPAVLGKISAESVEEFVATFYADENYEHMVSPGAVYISHPTEYGTLYTKAELEALRKVCDKYNMKLFMDGARLGYGLAGDNTDVTLETICENCDVFYIGGTKVGALCGEAVVFPKGDMPKHYLTISKRHGALLAKGRLLGIQFDALFTDDLYFEIGKHAMDMVHSMKQVFIDNGYEFFIDSPTNQLFVILDNDVMEKLKEQVIFSFWEKYDANHTVVRFATSWGTTAEEIEKLDEVLKAL